MVKIPDTGAEDYGVSWQAGYGSILAIPSCLSFTEMTMTPAST